MLLLANTINSVFINPLSTDFFKTLTNEVTNQLEINTEVPIINEETPIDSSVDCSTTYTASVTLSTCY